MKVFNGRNVFLFILPFFYSTLFWYIDIYIYSARIYNLLQIFDVLEQFKEHKFRLLYGKKKRFDSCKGYFKSND